MASPGNSPWRKPADIMRLRQLKSKKRILDKRMNDPSGPPMSPLHAPCSSSSVDRNNPNDDDGLRMNPFRRSPWKRQRRNHPSRSPSPLMIELGDELTPSSDSTLFQLLQSKLPTSSGSVNINVAKSVAEGVETTAAADQHIKHDQSWQSDLPFDWSLKTALRLTSVQPFPWNSGRLSTLEESSGITSFVRCLPLNYDADELAKNSRHEFALDTSPNGQLFQCCQVWMHPALPWLKLFPRHQTRAVVQTSTSAAQLQPQIQVSLLADWTESLRSLFHLLRARQCPYFYVCAQHFTVLFRAPGIGANPRMHALVTPTTRGFRAALTDEGVQFTLPLCQTQPSGVVEDEIILDKTDDREKEDLNNGQEQQHEADEDVVDWLKSVGVEDKMLAQLDRDTSNVKKQKEIDYRPQSLVCVEDGDVHALFNFLLNSKSCVANSGPFAGIPPTLLAPVAFSGSTLRPLKMRQHQAQKTNSTSSETLHMFDLTGPILPHVAHYLDELLQTRAQSASADKFGYDMQFSTLEPTRSFSAYSLPDDDHVPPAVFGQRSLSDCGLATHVLKAMCSQREGNVLRQVNVSANGYRWTS